MSVNKISIFIENKHDRLLSQEIDIDDNRVSVHSELIDAFDMVCSFLYEFLTTCSFATKKTKY